MSYFFAPVPLQNPHAHPVILHSCPAFFLTQQTLTADGSSLLGIVMFSCLENIHCQGEPYWQHQHHYIFELLSKWSMFAGPCLSLRG